MTTIRSPRGKRLTARQYVALHRALMGRHGDTPDCEEGHFGCAVWENGPCSAALAVQEGMEEYED